MSMCVRFSHSEFCTLHLTFQIHDHFLKLVNFHCLNKYFNANQISGIFKRFEVFYAGEGENFLQKEKSQ